MKSIKKLPWCFVVSSVMATTGTAELVFAAEADLFVEEILVTARKQTESLQDVPLSLTAIGEKTIQQLGIETTADVIKMSPGLTYSKGIGGQDVRPDIRGLTALSGRSNVAILVDGVDISTDALTGTGAGQMVSMGLYDIERVEIVRGPQSALFGRNAFGGAINYITKKPSSEFSARVTAELAEYDTHKGKLSVTGPVTDNLLYRLNLAHSETGGQYSNSINGAPLEKEDSDAVSVSLQFLPSDQLEILTRLDWAKQNRTHAAVATVAGNTCQLAGGQLVPGWCEATGGQEPVYIGTLPDVGESDIRLSDDNFLGMENEVLQFTALIDYEQGDYTLTSNTSITRVEGSDDFDLDHQPTRYERFSDHSGPSAFVFPWVGIGPGLPGTYGSGDQNPFNMHADVEFDRDVGFQDFRIAFDAGDDVRWLVGAEYYVEDYDNKNYSRSNGDIERDTTAVTGHWTGGPVFAPIGAPPGVGPMIGTLDVVLPYKEQRETTAWGVYGSFDWVFVEDWEVSISARYQEEKYEVTFTNADATTINSGPTPTPGGIPERREIEESDKFSAFNPRLVLSHHLNDDVMLYASAAQGTKPGGFTFQALLTDENKTYDQEKVLSYELGWKTSWLNDRVIVNGALFYMDNSDKQAAETQTQPVRVTFVNNIGETTSQGLELSVAAALTEGLSLTANYAFTDTRVDEYEIDEGLKGNELSKTPKHSALLTLQYDWNMSGQLAAYGRLDTRYMSERWGNLSNTYKLDQKTTVDFQVGISSDHWGLTAYVNNLFNDETAESTQGFVDFINNFSTLYVVHPAEKRNAGVRLSYQF